MESMLYVGSKIEKDTANNAAAAITAILKSCYDTRMSEGVVLEALASLTRVLEVKNVTITGCNISNDQSNTIELVVPEVFKDNTK